MSDSQLAGGSPQEAVGGRQSQIRNPQSAIRNLPYPAWLAQIGPSSEVVLSTRCRLARNISGIPFPWRASELQRKETAKAMADAIHRCHSELDHPLLLRERDIERAGSDTLIEWRYASPAWLHGGTHRLAAIGRSGALSILGHEEDHLRIQAILPGLQVESVYETVINSESALARYLHFAWSKDFGFLTASIANAGTGLRISILVHLAGLARFGALHSVLHAAHTLGCTVRGLYGEGSHGTGELFQVSNSWSYRGDADRAISKVASTAQYLVEAELAARRELFEGESGIHSLQRSSNHAMEALFKGEQPPNELLQTVSLLRLAVCAGLIPADLRETADWVSLAGLAAAAPVSNNLPFEAVRRSAELRNKLRTVRNRSGTL